VLSFSIFSLENQRPEKNRFSPIFFFRARCGEGASALHSRFEVKAGWWPATTKLALSASKSKQQTLALSVIGLQPLASCIFSHASNVLRLTRKEEWKTRGP
jgi:hypothetical protein